MRAPARRGRVFIDIETSAFGLLRMMARHLGALAAPLAASMPSSAIDPESFF
jgi:hypothetical protein